MGIILRPYQQECVDIIDQMKEGTGLVQMATGLGKTVVFTHIKRKGRILILSHRDELVHQPEEYYQGICSFGVEQKTEHSKPHDEVVSASVLTLKNRLSDFSPYDFDTIITDEAHHAVAPSYQKIYDYFKPRLHIGFTATPNRGDKLRLDSVYDKILYQKDLKWGMDNGYLCDIDCLRVGCHYDLMGVDITDGDFKTLELEKKMNTDEVNRDIAQIYQNHREGSTLIFVSSTKQAEALAKLIPNSFAITSNTSSIRRRELVEFFIKGTVPCLINCNILTEGINLPNVRTVIIARPTKNINLYTQMVGRGMRRIEGEKDTLKLIDCVSISESVDVCSAPSLLGFDINNISKERRKNIKGSLKDIEKNIILQSNTPLSWMNDRKNVEEYGREQKINMQKLNFSLLYNGDLLINIPESKKGVNGKCRIFIKAVDSLGKTYLIIKRYSKDGYDYANKKTNWKVEEIKSLPMSLQQAISTARGFCEKFYPVEKHIWDSEESKTYAELDASESQLNAIKKQLKIIENGKKIESEIPFETLKRGEATNILNHLYNQ